MVKNITFAVIWLLLCASWDQAQILPPIPPIVYKPILGKAAEVYNTSRVLTRSGMSPLPCQTDLKAVLNGSLEGCVEGPNECISCTQINYQESTLPVQEKPAALNFTHNSVHMSFTATDPIPVDHVIDPIYPSDNAKAFKEGKVVVEVKVRNGKLKSVSLLEPSMGLTVPPIVRNGQIPPAPMILRVNRLFVDAVFQAIQKWTFKPGYDSYFQVVVKFTIE